MPKLRRCRPSFVGLTAGLVAAFLLGTGANVHAALPDVPRNVDVGGSGTVPWWEFAYHAAPAETGTPDTLVAAPTLPFYVARKGDTTIYLLGTLHVGMSADFPRGMPFRPAIQAALNDSPTLALELSPDDLTASQGDVAHYGVCPRVCLPHLVSAQIWRAIHARLRANAEALALVSHMRPWLAALMIQTEDARSAGLQTEYGTEVQLENVYLGGRIVGLETLNEQMLAFTGLTPAEQHEMLAQSLAQPRAQDIDDLLLLHALWRAGDADWLTSQQAGQSARTTRDPALAKAIDERILYQRNRRFAVRILLLAQPRQPLFVAIGALHLGGQRGVLDLLKRYGYDVRPG